MLHAIIIDDKTTNIETLQGLIRNFCPNVQVDDVATNIEKGHAAINKYHPDIVFLDIEMNNETGFELLRMFTNAPFKTIFVTAYSQYAIQAFREEAIDYLLKPVDIRHLQEAVAKVEKLQPVKRNNHPAFENIIAETKISLPTQEGYLFVHYNEILRCEASGSYSNFYFTDGKKITISMRLKECEDILPPGIFCRVHNSHIININYVKKYLRGKGGQVILHNNTTVEISAARKEAFLSMIRNI